ncbi:hypothetical protein CLV90_3190 [Maribacter spongiicola]|uniref:DUF4325 domain-containing protein n=1 Tax=Maribacter spongiicola TaxID=1206753 RepID=A0A4V3EQH7_9FLAO|nr:DUF4325 domain-containing protein [Maribacter spongiicola]TDT41958.1 hypothetical protein CLV90_3190 [Maribacter spongiicola]
MSNLYNILDITPKTSTNSDGDVLFDFLSNSAVNDNVVLKIPGDVIISSSFLNSSVGKFIDVFGMENFKKNIKISCNRNIFNQLKKYVDFHNDKVC